MAAPKRSELQIVKDREEIASLYLEGKTQTEIAQKIGLSQAMISYDLKTITEEWKQSTSEDIKQLKAKELAKIEHREREAWTEWEKSKQETKKQTICKKVEGSQITIVTETRCGDPRYLDAIARCSKDRRELLGLDAPAKQEVAAVVISCKLPDGIDPSKV